MAELFSRKPSDWKVKNLEDIAGFITKGATPTTYGYDWAEEGNGSIPFLRSECVTANGFNPKGMNFIPQAAHDAMKRSQIFSGDILMTITGNIGRIATLPEDIVEANINQHIAKISIVDDISSEYVAQALKQEYYARYYERILTGQAYPQISLKQVRETPILLPTLEEQQKIAEVLSTVDEKIDLIGQKIAETQKLKIGLMQKLFFEGVGVQDKDGNWQPHIEFKDLPTGTYPSSWSPKTLGDICEKIGDGIHSTPKYVESSEYRFVNGNNIKNGRLVISDKTKCVSKSEYEKHRKELPLDTILLSINGTIGSLAYYDGSEVVLGKSAAYLCVKEILAKEFLYYFLSTTSTSKWFEKGLTGTTIKNLSLKAIRTTPIALPPFDEQKKIAQVLSTVDEKLELLELQKSETQQLKKGLMQKLLIGEWRFPLENSEAA